MFNSYWLEDRLACKFFWQMTLTLETLKIKTIDTLLLVAAPLPGLELASRKKIRHSFDRK